MISFDDLVDVGGDTEQLENDLRNVKLNTQANRFSIIDCTNSIETLSSNTLLLYNSLTTMTGGGGGGGFNYLESYSAHSTESFIYNCNDILSNQSFTNTFKEVGPNINFNAVSITTNQKLNLKGQTFNSCLIQSDTEHLKLNYASMDSNSIYNNNFIDMKVDTFRFNDVSSNTFINISGFSNAGNTYSNNNILHITDIYIYTNTIYSNKSVSINASAAENNGIRSINLVNFNAHSQSGNLIYGNSMLNTVNGFVLNSNSYAGSCAKICHYLGSGNTFVCSALDYTGYSISSNTVGAWKNGHVKIIYANDVTFGGNDNGGLLTFETFTADKVNISSIRGYCDIKAGSLQKCNIQYNTINNISAKNMVTCTISTNTICNIDVWSAYSYNKLNDNKYVKLNGYTDLKLLFNTFNNIETLKINEYNESMSKNSFNNISELHLKNGNIITNSTNSNTFGNISSYYFKYTDGLYDGTIFNSDYSSIYDKAFIKNVPCSWLNVGGGGSGGFDYWENYNNHNQNGYNVSGTVKSSLIANNIYSLGPYANFSNCTFQSVYEVHSLNCEKFHTNTFYNNQSEINIKASEFLNNTFMNCSMINVSACTFTGNSYIGNGVVNISANDMKFNNYIKNNDIANITCYNTDIINLNKPVISGNNYVNVLGDNLWSGSMIDNKFINVNCKTIKYFSISNTFNNITAYYIGNNTIAYHDTNINCLFNFSCSNFNDNSVQVRTNSFNLSALYMADNTFSNCSYLTINAGNISRLQLYSDSQGISVNSVLKLRANSIDSCNIMNYNRIYLDCPIMKNIYLNECPSIYLTTTYDFLKSWVYTSNYSNFNYSDKFIYGDPCSHFDFNDVDLVLDRFGGYSLTQIDKSKCYINGIPLQLLYPSA